MAPKILRRCTICKKFHASYLVEDAEFGKCYLCYSCWKSRQTQGRIAPEKKTEETGTDPETAKDDDHGSRTQEA